MRPFFWATLCIMNDSTHQIFRPAISRPIVAAMKCSIVGILLISLNRRRDNTTGDQINSTKITKKISKAKITKKMRHFNITGDKITKTRISQVRLEYSAFSNHITQAGPQVGTPTLRPESAPAGLEHPLTRVRLG